MLELRGQVGKLRGAHTVGSGRDPACPRRSCNDGDEEGVLRDIADVRIRK
jgi:hypothetical protein